MGDTSLEEQVRKSKKPGANAQNFQTSPLEGSLTSASELQNGRIGRMRPGCL